MLDDVERHGPHDLYWCYRFERNIKSYINIKTNQKENELTYARYEGRIAFTTSMKTMNEVDMDNFFIPQRAVLESHKHLLTENHRPGHSPGMHLY